jgi:hypothetical protein
MIKGGRGGAGEGLAVSGAARKSVPLAGIVGKAGGGGAVGMKSFDLD